MDLVALGAGLVPGEVGHPDVAVPIQANAVRRHHHALADVGEHLARAAIELEHRIDRVVVAIDGAAAGRAGAAAFVGPDVAVLRIDVDAGADVPHFRPAGSSPQLWVTLGAGFGSPSPVMKFPTLAWAYALVMPVSPVVRRKAAHEAESGDEDS